jgi:hypothetical protein
MPFAACEDAGELQTCWGLEKRETATIISVRSVSDRDETAVGSRIRRRSKRALEAALH